MDTAEIIAYGQCFGCQRVFPFNTETVPSVRIHTSTGLPIDMCPCGLDTEAHKPIAIQAPMCPACVTTVNAIRISTGREPHWPTPPDRTE